MLGFEELDHDFTDYKDKMLSIETIQSHIGGASKGRCLNTTAFPGSDHNAHSHLDIQANKINANHLHAQHSTNA